MMKNAKSLLQMPKNQTRVFSQLLTGLLLLLILSSGACNSGATDEPQMVTVGVINLAPVLEPIFDGFKDRMTELGYVEGENITYLYDGPTGDIDQLSVVAQEFVDQNVDLILALSTPGTAAAMKTTQEIPIIFAPISDPIRSGFVTNLANPGGNATGVQWGLSEPRRLEWLLTLDPDIQTIYLPYNPEDGSATVILEDIQETAVQLNVELILEEA
jgi:putative ABC transport system substrate-binding protein